ncbi:unnamed protein product [marine sediment metagenome]|uniref:Uncharacterized protein n=1 Tax=marine sediment metagenome TaxID=412755 RepID=X1CEK4_9ZZZZ
MKEKDKYKAVLVIKEGRIYKIHKEFDIKATTTRFKEGEGLFLVNIGNPTYTEGLTRFYYFNLITGVQISFRKMTKAGYTPKDMNLLLGSHVISELVIGIGKKKTGVNLFQIVLALATGGAFGYIIAGVI